METGINYVNLSRGIHCPHSAMTDNTWRFLRLQSTWCEQKRWEDTLWVIPDDMLILLCQGVRVTVHDCSEKPRETRACWQGLAWVRYALSKSWNCEAILHPRANDTGYWSRIWYSLEPRTYKRLSYYKQFVVNLRAIELYSCYVDP